MTELYVPLSFEKRLLRYQTPSFSLTIDTIFCHIVPLTPGGHDKRCPLFLGYPMIQFHEPKKREWFTIVIPWFFHSWSHYLVPKWSHILKCLSHDSMVKLLDFMEKSQLFHVQLEKKTRFHFSIDFSHFFCDVWDDLPQLRRRWPGNARANHAAVPAASADGVPWPTECFVAVIPKVTIPLTIVIYI